MFMATFGGFNFFLTVSIAGASSQPWFMVDEM
jgi:hypothetical protein